MKLTIRFVLAGAVAALLLFAAVASNLVHAGFGSVLAFGRGCDNGNRALAIAPTRAGAPAFGMREARPAPEPQETRASDVEYGSFHSDSLGADLNFAIQLPPSYKTDKNRRYPVLYFLHGMFGTEKEFERRGIAAAVEKMRAEGKFGDFIIVAPAGGNSFYVNAKNGVRYEDAIVKDLIPYVERTYRAIGTREGRAIQGISMGGFGALMIAFKHPEMFSSVTTHCAALFVELPKLSGDDRRSQFVSHLIGNIFGDPPDDAFFQSTNPISLAEADAAAIKKAHLNIYFDVGDQDRYGFQKTNTVLDEKLTKAGIPHEFHVFPGNHGWEYMLTVADHSYEFLWKHFSAAEGHRAAK
ncbi:MAG TPA: alpha/beta hydrolase-fold protein [Blastocatellia bacterium]|nr:alpha/beta hydrolase-fold protein [Blastocatellia bacterium]